RDRVRSFARPLLRPPRRPDRVEAARHRPLRRTARLVRAPRHTRPRRTRNRSLGRRRANRGQEDRRPRRRARVAFLPATPEIIGARCAVINRGDLLDRYSKLARSLWLDLRLGTLALCRCLIYPP